MTDMPRVTFTFEGKRYYVKGKTKKEAAMNAALKKKQLEEGRIKEQRISVNEWFEKYISIYKNGIREKTVRLYKSIYRNAAAPYIGAVPICKVKNINLQEILNNQSDKSAAYVAQLKSILGEVFKKAEENGLIARSPAVNLTLPKCRKGERRALTEEERKLFLAAADSLGQKGLFFKVIYYCGLRPSEVARIEGEDIDFENGLLRVRGTKTKAAVRTVIIPSNLMLPKTSGLLFATRSGSIPSSEAMFKWFKKVKEEMENISGNPVAEDLTAYCLRHDYCTRLQEADVPIDIARRLMGHSNISTTSRVYTHESRKALELARSRIEKAQTGSQQGSQ